VNTGEVVVRTIETGGHAEYTPVGHVTNLAARMQTAAPAGSIAASQATQRLCEGYFEFCALGPTAVKGLNPLVEVYEVVRAAAQRVECVECAAMKCALEKRGRRKFCAQGSHPLHVRSVSILSVAESGCPFPQCLSDFKNSFRVLPVLSSVQLALRMFCREKVKLEIRLASDARGRTRWTTMVNRS